MQLLSFNGSGTLSAEFNFNDFIVCKYSTYHVSVCMVDVLTDSCVWLVCDGNGGHCRLFQ